MSLKQFLVFSIVVFALIWTVPIGSSGAPSHARRGGLLSTEVDKKGCEKKALSVTVRCCRASTKKGMLQRHQLQQGHHLQ
jgi:hypothetical protein